MRPDSADPLHAGDVPADDRCFLFGDGLFETMLVVDRRIAFAERHLERLQHGARRLAISPVPDPLAEVIQAVPEIGRFAVRLTLSRGSGPRGYGSLGAGPAALRVRVTPLDRDPLVPLPPARLGLSTVIMAEQPLLAGIKHCNRLEQVLAADEAKRLALDESLLRNSSGAVQCAISANVFVLADGHLMTPPCDRSGVAGTRRALVLEELAAHLDLAVRERTLSVADVRSADGLALTSALAGVRLVARFEDHDYEVQEPLRALQASYCARLQQCLVA